MKILNGEIISNERYGDNLNRIGVFSPYICNEARPGQFVNIKCSPEGTMDPFLRRPFSIFDVEKNFNVFSILFFVRGKGTKYLSNLEKGDNLDFVGPLGNGVDLNMAGKSILLIGGGIGIAPLHFIATEAKKLKKEVFFVAGFKDKSYIRWERDLIELNINYAFLTEDGSWGEKGLVSDYIRENIEVFKDYDIYCCGPVNMLKKMQNIYEKTDNRLTALLEEMMACGVGVCNGCVVKIKKGKRGFSYNKVCKDGPAFDLREVIFD
jgi:dihydroorotate dehydrogenase electron transfer subunit